jgi:hypothetical protein
MDGGMSALSGTVSLPGLGPVKKVYVLGAVGVVAAILGIAYYRRSRVPAAPDTTTNPIDYSTTDTGYSNGAGGGGGSGGGYGGTAPWPWGYDAAGNPLPAPVPGGTANPGGAINTNAEWASQAIGLLEDGGNTEAIASGAVTGVLGGIGVTSDQEALFLRAVGVLGDPPQGYPKPIRLVAPPSDPTPTPDNPAPQPPGATAGHKAPAAVTGLKASAKTTTTVTLTWKTVPNARGYHVYRNGARIVTVTYGTAKISNMKANTSYTFAVQTLGTNGQVSALSSIHVTTAKPATVKKTIKK